MRVVEVSNSEGGELSHSGVQVEYVSAARVESVWPSSGVVSGGTVVTLSGEGFVAGRTACQFGSSGSLVAADVLSSSEAQCVSVVGPVGEADLAVYTGAAVAHHSDFKYYADGTVASISPGTVSAVGGDVITVTVPSSQSGSLMRCIVDGTVSVSAQGYSADVGEWQCRAPAMSAGNHTVEVSSNGQDWTVSSGVMVEAVASMNVSTVDPAVVLGGSEVS